MTGHADGEVVPADTCLTQLGHVKIRLSRAWSRTSYEFRCCPSDSDDGHVSLLEGALTVEQTVPLIARGDSAGSADCVRHVEAGALTKAGFKVLWRPLPTLPGHVGVYSDVEWNETVSEAFDQCFTEYLRG
jgi:hypothetical protein